MLLYEMTSSNFRPVPEASFAAMGIGDRSDIQRLLRAQIDVLRDDLYVLTEEFGEWEDSKGRTVTPSCARRSSITSLSPTE